jgi:hypothetical protein
MRLLLICNRALDLCFRLVPWNDSFVSRKLNDFHEFGAIYLAIKVESGCLLLSRCGVSATFAQKLKLRLPGEQLCRAFVCNR